MDLPHSFPPPLNGGRRRHSSASYRIHKGEQQPLLSKQQQDDDDDNDLNGRNRRRRASITAPQRNSAPSASMRRASAALLQVGSLRGKNSIIDVRQGMELHPLRQQTTLKQPMSEEIKEEQAVPTDAETSFLSSLSKIQSNLRRFVMQIPAILLVCLLNLMLGIPFGVSYFPVGWSSTSGSSSSTGASDGTADDGISGAFPLPGKEALGIRMFLFATFVGQIAYTFASKFKNPIALQMVENIPFCHALAFTVIAEQGYGMDALSTLFFLFGLSSVIVGVTFYALGKLKLGRVVYYFPAHVLIGCIGGIGVFIVFTAIEVTTDSPFRFNIESIRNFANHLNLFGVVVFWEVLLRVLSYFNKDKSGQPYFALLSPIFFCLITPLFYLGLWLFGIDQDTAQEAGYFFPSASDCDGDEVACGSSSGLLSDEHLFDIFHVIDLRSISWIAVAQAIPTLVAVTAFSLIHVPINIPAFAVSTNADTDMNAELIAHGYSNFFSGIVGGLQNYLCYSNSVLYAKSGGEGKVSSLIIAAVTSVLFVVGPSMAAYIPRCMAGTLLLHLGIDLILEGVYDSFGKFDMLEYAGIWVITIVMTCSGMSAALIAGVISALLTYAMQSVAHHKPIRKTLTGSTLRSSKWNRPPKAHAVLEDDMTGRHRILIFQLQGHLFFGNIAQLTDDIKQTLSERKDTDAESWILIIDFTLVVGMDSSAAHAVGKLKAVLNRAFDVPVTLFVTGNPLGFPCEYDLSKELSKPVQTPCTSSNGSVPGKPRNSSNGSTVSRRGSVPFARDPCSMRNSLLERGFARNRVCADLDEALKFAEDVLIARADSDFLRSEEVAFLKGSEEIVIPDNSDDVALSPEDERLFARTSLLELLQGAKPSGVDLIFNTLQREEYKKGDILWCQGQESHSAKLLCRGTLISRLEGTDTVEIVRNGHFLGETGLVYGLKRLTTVECMSETAVVYSLGREDWEWMVEKHPAVARLLDLLCIRYLTQRCQNVSNRIWTTRCVPV